MISLSRHRSRDTRCAWELTLKFAQSLETTPELYKILHKTTHCLFTKMANLRPCYLNIKSIPTRVCYCFFLPLPKSCGPLLRRENYPVNIRVGVQFKDEEML